MVWSAWTAQSWTWVRFARSSPTQSTNSLTQSNPIHDACPCSDPHPIHRTPQRRKSPEYRNLSNILIDLMHASNDVNSYYSNKNNSKLVYNS